jgi:hypothetical protein
MASNDDLSEFKPLEQGVVETPAQDSANAERQDNHDAGIPATDHSQPPDPEHQPDTAIKAEESQPGTEERKSAIQLPELTARAPAEFSDGHQETAAPQQGPSNITHKQTNFTESTSQILAGIPQTEVVETQAHAPPASTPESLRGNPYMLSRSLTVASREPKEVVDVGEERDVDAQHDVAMSQNMGSHTTHHPYSEGESQPTHIHQESPSETADIHSASHHPHEPADDDDDERPMSVDDESSDESDASENEEQDVKEENYIMQLKTKVARARSALQRHRMFSQTPLQNDDRQPKLFTEQDSDSGFNDNRASQFAQHQSSRAANRGSFVPPYASGHPDMMQAQQRSMSYQTAFQPSGRQDRSMSNNHLQGQVYMASANPMMPSMYLSSGPGFQQHPSHGPMHYQIMNYPVQSYGEAPLHQEYPHFPGSSYEVQSRPVAAPSSNRWPQGPSAAHVQRNTQLRKPQQAQDVDDSDCTDDDEPLRTRAPRHPSILGDSDTSSPAPAPKSSELRKKQDQGSNYDIEFVSSKPSMGFKAPKPKKSAPKLPSASEPPQTPRSSKQDSVSSNSPIDWKLPTYEASFEAPKTKDEPTIAKISIPNLVREKLLLSPDHAEQETHLLLNVFLPAQKELATPDPSPALAVLNFHTIAVMVIEAYIQFEIGDEFGTGRGHWHSDHDRSDAEYVRLRDAKDADTDEIFFAVIDRWRAGAESNKQPSKMIRGAQEFCDVALDVIFYVKKHGLLATERAKEEERARKEKEVVKEKGAEKKRGAQKVSEPRVRKKAKTVKEKEDEKKKTRPRASTAAVTVTRAPRRK